jgi:two-component system, sensor histidine kinase and response regulator
MASTKQTILLADDNPENLDLLSRVLEAEGYHIRTARNGQLALNSIMASPPDIALIDIHMPVMDGYALCREIKNNPGIASTPVIFISAIGESFNKVIAFDLGAVDYISKPIDPREVVARVQTHMKVSDLQKQLLQQNNRLEILVQERTEALDHALEELRHVNQRLMILDEAKNDFLRLISHELRTPLVGLGIMDELLSGQPLDVEDARHYQDIFWASHQKLLNIVDHATLLTQINFDDQPRERRPSLLREVLEQAVGKLKPILASSGVQIRLPADCSTELPLGVEFLAHAFNALFETAVKFSAPGQTVIVETRVESGRMLVMIDATGWTLEQQHIDLFFEVFSIKEALFPGGDLGLGPAVARKIIGLCDGSVTVSNRDGLGIRLTVSFPQSQ